MIEVTHAPPGARVTLTVSSTDARGFHWRSSTVYRATKAGIVNPAENVAVSGSYKGLDAMGPIDYMSSPTANNEYCYCWAGKGADRFSFTAVVGHQQASVKVKRKFGEFAGPAPEELARQRFVGEYYSPLHPKSPGPAVLLFGGSEGGLGGGFMASELAADGYPTLDLAYFKEPGLPQLLYRIPLEYFADALRWLARQPGVEKSRIWVAGASRGSEAALLLGVHYPSLVHGVVALVASDASLCSYPYCEGPAWTFNGKPIPYTRQFDQPHPTGNPAAVIPVAKIRGPILLSCGGQDQVWYSCGYAQVIMAELARAHDPYRHRLMASPDGGHGSALQVPYEPGLAVYASSGRLAGSTMVANAVAWAQQWPQFLNFIHN